MQQQLLSALSSATGIINLRPWGLGGASFEVPHSDDPCYATQAPGGLVLVWWARAHADEWAQHCRDENLVDPREELIYTSAHHAYTSADQLVEVIGYWAALGRLPA
jgi:hypothetical protein